MNETSRWTDPSLLDPSVPPDPHSGFIPLKRDQAALLLRSVIESAKLDRAVVAFDLDSTVLNNAPRQSLILREYGEFVGEECLRVSTASDWQGWSFTLAMQNAGLSQEDAERHAEAFRPFWRERFFTSDYCHHDTETEGAATFLQAIHKTGAKLVYVTGRHEAMREGSRKSFENFGFPDEVDSRVELIMKPTLEADDDAFKQSVYTQLAAMGTLVAAFDNEPAHINGYKESCPNALAVHMATDHSMRPIKVLSTIPSIRDFSMTAAQHKGIS